VLFFTNLIFINWILGPLWWFFGIVEVLTFFYFANSLTRKWSRYSEKKFNRKLFQNAIIIRISWVLISYAFYNIMNGRPFEFDSADAAGYHGEASWLADMIHSGNIQPYLEYLKGRFSDMGYTFYLGFQYAITDKSILIERLLKALYGAFTCVLIYKLAKRNFGEAIARMAAIFCMIMPNLILYCGIHTKEVEMVLLTVAFMERADFLLRSKDLNFLTLAPTLLLASSLFFFRTVLGATALFALFTALMFSTTHVLNMGKRVILVVWVLGTVAYFAGSGVANEIEATWNARGGNQETSMNMRATEVNGNKFVKKIGGAVFAPLILVIPFPTIIETPKQENQKLINGGNYVKNVMAFFVLFTIFTVIRMGKWREYLLLGSFTIGYSLVLAFSAFAHSERFHQPTLPFELILAAVGISLMTNKTKKYYNWWMIFLFVAIVGWSWFKLAGRGMT
jgi:hypothetical protein